MAEIEYPGRLVFAKIWLLEVGRVKLYLLDSDIDENSLEDRQLTDALYGGDNEFRLRQEILLGMGGFKALQTLGLSPDVYHLNEGHAAFVQLQRLSDPMSSKRISLDEATEVVRGSSLFTTHTPVPAGNDMFEAALVERYFGGYCREVGIPFERLLQLGRQNPSDTHEPFCMTVLALRLSAEANGVSKLHGEAARTRVKTSAVLARRLAIVNLDAVSQSLLLAYPKVTLCDLAPETPARCGQDPCMSCAIIGPL